MYRLGVVPWDGHPLATSLTELVEGDDARPPGKALDVGCGTGDNSIYLAQHGWQVTGIDFIPKAVEQARAKAAAQKVSVQFAQADVTRLSAAGFGNEFDLIIDSGCLHGMSPEDRDAYVREVTAVAAPGARLHITAFIPGGSFGVPGIAAEEVQQRFSQGWAPVASGVEAAMDRGGKGAARYYVFQRAS
jgi:ubiquinone/menaquinone biosynthesis C-methylase UbiE